MWIWKEVSFNENGFEVTLHADDVPLMRFKEVEAAMRSDLEYLFGWNQEEKPAELSFEERLALAEDEIDSGAMAVICAGYGPEMWLDPCIAELSNAGMVYDSAAWDIEYHDDVLTLCWTGV